MESRCGGKEIAQKKYMEGIKNNPIKKKKYLEKAAERMKKHRSKLKQLASNNKKVLNSLREKERIKKQKMRIRIANERKETNITLEPYNSKQSFGKALKKAEMALPKEAAKRTKIVQALFAKYGQPAIFEKPVIENSQVINEVQNFFVSSDISVQSAGKKDTLIVDGEIIPKRFMLLTVAEAYEIYKNECTSEPVSKSFFYSCRPRHVQLSSKMPHNMCVCIYHANFAFLLDGWSKIVKSFSGGHQHFLKSVCCNIENKNCMSNRCGKCVTDLKSELLPLAYLNQMDEEIQWKHWRKVNDRITLTNTVGPFSDLINELEVQLPKFKEHFFVKRVQQNHFDTTKNNLKENELVLQLDFAENYRILFQNEIQSAHFNYKQVSIFTCVAWTVNKTQSFAIISNSLKHSKIDVYIFLTKILEELKQEHGYFNKIFIFSDGSSCQFKNKFIIYSLMDFKIRFGCEDIEWNFFATSHGKGAVDGVGAVINRKIWHLTKTKNICLNDALDLYQCAQEHIKGIKILYVDEGQINETPFMTDKWNNLPNITGIIIIF